VIVAKRNIGRGGGLQFGMRSDDLTYQNKNKNKNKTKTKQNKKCMHHTYKLDSTLTTGPTSSQMIHIQSNTKVICLRLPLPCMQEHDKNMRHVTDPTKCLSFVIVPVHCTTTVNETAHTYTYTYTHTHSLTHTHTHSLTHTNTHIQYTPHTHTYTHTH
jgi:predicted nucleic-acid-binding Zn-ribbon protein